jgi:hypothetical protein
MTAEVAILNTKGIALAADSAVTLGAASKTYNTADKLFALSKYHPVGIMIYGSARIMGIEWETIIKSYRDSLRDKSFDSLSEYAHDFINYLTKFHYFTSEQKLDYLKSMCYEVFSNTLTRFLGALRTEFEDKEDFDMPQIDGVFNKSLKSLKEEMKKTEDEKQINVDTEYIDSNIKPIHEMTKVIFEEYPLTKKQIAELVEILKLNFQKCGWDKNPTGIVIAGYGEREIFPTLCDFEVSGKLGDSLIYYGYETGQINTDDTALIAPFAQSDMVHQFVRGIDNDFRSMINDRVSTILDMLAPLINDAKKEKTSAISELLRESMLGYTNTVFREPILSIVESMAQSELVSMAEAMVNLTALKRHVSTDEESVGGPIDVALITKGEGFIWIKKKTTYDPHLNRDLNQNYFRS